MLVVYVHVYGTCQRHPFTWVLFHPTSPMQTVRADRLVVKILNDQGADAHATDEDFEGALTCIYGAGKE